MAAFGSSTSRMSFPANATEAGVQNRVSELLVAGSLEVSPRELHRAAEIGRLLPKDTCIYIPSLPGLPLSRTLEAVAAMRDAGLDPVPHVSARRVLDKDEFEKFIRHAVAKYRVHRVLLLGGDEPKPKGPFNDSLQILESRMLVDSGIREIGVAGYPEGHPRIAASKVEEALARKMELTRMQGLGMYIVTQFSFAPQRVVDYCSRLARSAPDVSVYVGVAGPTDPIALARFAQLCGVSTSLRALKSLGTGIARLVTNVDPRDQVVAIARYTLQREPSNVVGVHMYSFGGAVKTASWMRELI